MRIYAKPTPDDLKSLIAEGTHNGAVPIAEWHTKFLDSAAAILRSNPPMYRNYGCYWWILKKELADHGYNLGDFLDPNWVEALDYGDTSYNIAAAYAYFDYVVNQCIMYSPMHSYYYHDTESDAQAGEVCWEMGVYTINDDDMEFRDPQ